MLGAAVFEIRPYIAADRPAVRSISHATGYMGEPAGWFWRDKESFADLTTGYYTDNEPDSAFVVVGADGKVVGYLLGCIDTSRKTSLNRTIVHHSLGRALLLRPGTAGVLWRGAADLVRGRPPHWFADERYPAHFHIDLLPVARGSGAGGRLVDAFLERLVAAGVPGVHIETLAPNEAAIRFFESLGFEWVATGPERWLPGWRTRSGERISIVAMTKQLP